MHGSFQSLASAKREAAESMVREIAQICRNLPRRAPGSEGEREAAEYMASVLKQDCGCHSVQVEHFNEHPDAFYGYFYFSMTLDILCCLTFFVSPWMSLLFGGLALLLFVFQFVLYRQIIDRAFPLKEGTNVTAVRPCSEKPLRRVLINGHIDAAWEFPLNEHFGGIVFEIPGIMAVVGVLFYMTLAVIRLCGNAGWVSGAGLAGLVFLPFFALVALTYNPRRIVDGANDNLSGCMIGISMLREMERQGIVPEHTEIGVLLTGSEEAGLRGAKAWCEAHPAGEAPVPTAIICLDTIHDPDQLMVNFRDLNGTVRADRELGTLILETAGDAGIPCKKGWVPPLGGSTDSAAFCQGGYRTVGVTGLNHRLEDYYHTRRDTPDRLNTEGLQNCFELMVRVIERIDSGELDH